MERYEKNIKFVEQPTGPAPDPETVDPDTINKYYEAVNLEQEVVCLMLSSMSPDLQRTLEKYNAYDMLKELKTMSVSKLISLKDEELLGNTGTPRLLQMPNKLGVSLILNSLNKAYDQFVQNYNMHSMRKTIAELHVMLKLYEKGIPKKAETPAVFAIREGKIQKDKKNPRGAKSKDNGNNKLALWTPSPRSHRRLREIIRQRTLSATTAKRSVRIPQAPNRYGFYVDVEEYELGDLNEPPNYKAALSDPEFDKWLEAMNTKMQSMEDNQVWVLVDLPPNGRTVRSKWLFKKKTNMDGNVHTFKARLVAKGYTQTYGVDYGETFSLVTDIRAIRILLAMAAFVDPKHPNKVCKLQRSIYGLKQVSRSWNKRFDVEIKKIGFTQNPNEPCVYLKASRSNVTFLILYVDDILLMGNNVTMLQEVKSLPCSIMNTKDMVLLYEAKPEAELKSVKQSTTALSSIEAEYIAAAEASMKAVHMRKFIDGLGGVVPSNKRPMKMLCDNEPVIAIANDPRILKGA
ncbi:retrotransposon protein, putative, ty1-copia subclass [Tanacetum coccineum]